MVIAPVLLSCAIEKVLMCWIVSFDFTCVRVCLVCFLRGFLSPCDVFGGRGGDWVVRGRLVGACGLVDILQCLMQVFCFNW
jgi:hypothetical protein